MINLVAPIKFNAASDDARSDDLCDPTNTIGIGNPASANERKDDVFMGQMYP